MPDGEVKVDSRCCEGPAGKVQKALMEGAERLCVEKELHQDEQVGDSRQKCDVAKRGLLWAASRLYALDSSEDGVCARRVGNVLGGPYRDV